MSQPRVWVGRDEQQESHIDPRDRGFTLGDGLFETLRVVRGATPLLPLHLARLRSGARTIGLGLLWTDAFLTDAVAATLGSEPLLDGSLRITVSRGVPRHRGLLPDDSTVPTLVVDARPLARYAADLYARGATAITTDIRRDEHSRLAGVKSLSRLDSVLARRAAAEAGADEAIVRNTRGRIAGASAANVFVVRDGRLLTPALEEGALPGTVRGLLLNEVAPALRIAVREGAVEPVDLATSDEAFLTNALLGVLGLTDVDGQRIGDGQPGPLTLALAGAWRRRIGLNVD